MADHLNFGQALEALKEGKKVSRSGWNGKGMWLVLIGAKDYEIDMELGKPIQQPWIAIKTPDNKIHPWNASQADIFAEDWGITA